MRWLWFWLLMAALIFNAVHVTIARADPNLAGSDEAMIFGASGIPTPSAGYAEAADKLYLEPLGFNGTTVIETTPETSDFGPSVTAGEADVTADVLKYFGCTNTCVGDDLSADHPLTLFGYSQGAVVLGDDESTLASDGIPSDKLDIVLVGDTASAQGGLLHEWALNTLGGDVLALLGWSNLEGNTTPDNYFPTDVTTIDQDGWANFGNLPLSEAITGMFTAHLEYLGVTPAELASGTTFVDGMTDYNDISLSFTQGVDALLAAASADAGLSAATSAIAAAVGL